MKNKLEVYSYYIKDNTPDFSEVKRSISTFDFKNMTSIRVKWDRVPNSDGWVRFEVRFKPLEGFGK